MKKFSPLQSEVMDALYTFVNGLTREELARHIGRKNCSICARVGELWPYIKVSGRRLDPITKVRVEVLTLNYRGLQIMKNREARWLAA